MCICVRFHARMLYPAQPAERSASVRICPVRGRCIFKLHSGAAVRVPAGRGVCGGVKKKIEKSGRKYLTRKGKKR